MNSYEIIDEFGFEAPEVLTKVIDKALEKENVENSIFNIIFVGSEEIQQINKEYRGKDSVTDVISFALMDGKKLASPVNVLGDIYVCIPRMYEQAENYGHSTVREICFLCVHGILHLLGYDHSIDEEEKEMFRKQEEVLNEFEETKRNNN